MPTKSAPINVIEEVEAPVMQTPAPASRRRTNVVFMHGDKGGVGKSATGRMVGSRALALGMKMHVIETDQVSSDLKSFFEKSVPVTETALDAKQKITASDDAKQTGTPPLIRAQNLLGEIETVIDVENPPDVILINGPAGAGAVLDAFASLIEEILIIGLDCDLTVGYMVDDTAEVLSNIEESLESGLLSLPSARLALIYTGWKVTEKKTLDQFPIASSSARAAAIDRGLMQFTVPGYGPAVPEILALGPGQPYYELLDRATAPKEIKMAQRSTLATYLARTERMTDWLLNREAGNG